MTQVTRFPYQGTALPEDTDTETLFDSSTFKKRGMLQMAGFHKCTLGIWASQNGTVNEYGSEDGGTTWRLVSTTAVTGGGSTETTLEFNVEPYRDWKIEWVNAVTQTAFTVHLSLSTESL